MAANALTGAASFAVHTVGRLNQACLEVLTTEQFVSLLAGHYCRAEVLRSLTRIGADIAI